LELFPKKSWHSASYWLPSYFQEAIRGGRQNHRNRLLTLREREVLRWLARGKSNTEIGAILGISSATVGKHLEHIHPKLGVENRTAAISIFSRSKGRSGQHLTRNHFKVIYADHEHYAIRPPPATHLAADRTLSGLAGPAIAAKSVAIPRCIVLHLRQP
jgi:DNA-binding CsgD family transcriptional regulator